MGNWKEVFARAPVNAWPEMSRFVMPGTSEAPYKTSPMFPVAEKLAQKHQADKSRSRLCASTGFVPHQALLLGEQSAYIPLPYDAVNDACMPSRSETHPRALTRC
jgi:hypothetical protein